MTTREFETAAKKAICDFLMEEYAEKFHPEDISTVWLCHIIGNKKGIFIDGGRNGRYYEVTWNAPIQEMYVDMYQKKDKMTYEWDQVKFFIKEDKTEY